QCAHPRHDAGAAGGAVSGRETTASVQEPVRAGVRRYAQGHERLPHLVEHEHVHRSMAVCGTYRAGSGV
ncbi:hypothetical protein ABTD32_19870, partial [Acinetobacter baumannii]